MARGIATVEFEAEVQYLVDHWKRSALATFQQGVTIADPGHGLDEISPVTVAGIPFDSDNANDVAPFAPKDLRDRTEGGVHVDGTGFLLAELKPDGRPTVISPGSSPEVREDHVLDVTIVTPAQRGPALAMAYAGALSMLFRYVDFEPAEAGIDYIRNVSAPAERPMHRGDDGSWRYDGWAVRLSRFYRAPAAGAVA